MSIPSGHGTASERQYQELSAESRLEQQRHAETIRQYETRRRARAIAVPTAVDEVKHKLRMLGHPATLFGETHYDRRERLREVIAGLQIDNVDTDKIEEFLNAPLPSYITRTDGTSDETISITKSTKPTYKSAAELAAASASVKEVQYTIANEALQNWRKIITEESFQRSKQRLDQWRSYVCDSTEIDQKYREMAINSQELTLNLSQLADDRPLTTIRVTSGNDSPNIALGTFGGIVKIYEGVGLNCQATLRGHSDRITRVAWQDYQSTNSITNRLLASTSADGCILWNPSNVIDTMNHDDTMMDEDRKSPLLCRFSGHSSIFSSVEFHPTQKTLLGTSCNDFSWSLWDIETQVELQLQDGHTKECSNITFHPDGSLVLTTDSAGVALLWDLRSGQMIQGLQGHIKKISNAQFSPNGFQAVTCALDNTVKVWDLRQRKCFYTLPAHSNALTDVRFSPCGEQIVTSSFDQSIRVWNTRNWQILRTLTGHGDKVFGVDWAPDGKHLYSVGYERTVKLWAHKDEF